MEHTWFIMIPGEIQEHISPSNIKNLSLFLSKFNLNCFFLVGVKKKEVNKKKFYQKI